MAVPHLGIDVTGLVITADALHTCRTTARAIIDAGAHYLLILKDNQPTLLEQAAALPAPAPPPATRPPAPASN